MPFVRDTGTGACEDKQGLRPSSWVSDGSLMRGCLPCAALACVAGDVLCGHQPRALEEAFFSLVQIYIKKWTSQAMVCFPAGSPLQILFLHIQGAASPSRAFPKSESGCDTITLCAAPRGRWAGDSKAGWEWCLWGGSCHVSLTRPSCAHQSACKRYPNRRNP